MLLPPRYTTLKAVSLYTHNVRCWTIELAACSLDEPHVKTSCEIVLAAVFLKNRAMALILLS